MASTLSKELTKIYHINFGVLVVVCKLFFSKTVSYLKIELFDTELRVLGKFIICIFEGKYCIFTAIFVWKRTTINKSLGFFFCIFLGS